MVKKEVCMVKKEVCMVKKEVCMVKEEVCIVKKEVCMVKKEVCMAKNEVYILPQTTFFASENQVPNHVFCKPKPGQPEGLAFERTRFNSWCAPFTIQRLQIGTTMQLGFSNPFGTTTSQATQISQVGCPRLEKHREKTAWA